MNNGWNKKPIVYFILAALILWNQQLLSAQSVNKPYYNFKTYTTSDGLSSNHVECFYEDSKGFLWIGTDRGLQRYNGSTFLTFRHLNNDSNSIANEIINSITEDKHQNIWIATPGSITRFSYSNGKFTNYIYGSKSGHKILLGEVFCFFEDSKGTQWIGTAETGLYFFDKTKQQFVHTQPLAGLGMKLDYFWWIRNIQETAKQELVFTVRDGFVIIDKEGRQRYLQVPAPANKQIIYQPSFVLPLLPEYPDEIWVGACFNGLYKYSLSQRKWTHFTTGEDELDSDFIWGITRWNNNEWLLGYYNLCFFNHRTGTFKKAFDDKIIKDISRICYDNNGNLWLSSITGGLHLLTSNTSTQLFSSSQSIAGWGKDRLIYYDNDLQMLYGINPFYTNSIHTWSPATNTTRRDTILYFTRHIKAVNNFIADNDNLYFATYKGLCRYDLNTHQFDTLVYKDQFSNSQNWNISGICKSGKNIYFTNGEGRGGPLAFDKATHRITDLSIASAGGEFQKNHDNSIIFNDDILYIGPLNGDSIFSYNERTGRISAIGIPAGYRDDKLIRVNCLCIDKHQNLWCASSNTSIYVYNIPSQKWRRHISQADGFFATAINEMVCDEDSIIWCNSSEGLFAFNPNNFSFKNYKIKDGLLNESGAGHLAVMPGHQVIYNNIQGDNISFGFIKTKPADTTRQIIPISITNLHVLGKAFLTDTLLDNVAEVILPPGNNTFSLNYAGVILPEGKNLLYKYFLEGAEMQWHDAGNELNLSYINLSPGKYQLHIKCSSLDGQVAGKERLLHITLLPVWYQTWWFRLFTIGGSLILLFFAIRYYYTQQIKKQQATREKEKALIEERNRIAADMHDDVGADLSRIRYITSSMQSNNQVKDTDINKIVSLSDEAVEKMNEIIWALNQGSQQLEELLYYTRSQCSEIINNAGISFTFELPENIPAKVVGWKDCRNIYLLVKEAVNNAVRHSGATSIAVECSISGQVQFSITDNGKGFDSAMVRKNGNGLNNYQKRIAVLKGTYEIKSGNGNGTCVVLSIPLNKL